MKRVFVLTISLLLVSAVGLSAQVAEEWVVRYDGPASGYDCAYAIAVDGSGNVYVTGYSDGSGTGYYDYATVKYSPSGVEQWVARYNGPANGLDIAKALAIDGAGNVYVTGGSGGDYATVKYNSAGTEQWVARYDGPASANDGAYAIALDDAGNVYVTGSSEGSGTFRDYATVKYNPSGTEEWVARYDGPGNYLDVAKAIAIDDSGNVYVTGRSVGSGIYWDYATVKYSSTGVQQWVARYDGPAYEDDRAHTIAVDGSGNVYVTGGIRSSRGDYDYATIKYNSVGNQQWVARYNGPGNDWDVATSIALDDAGNVYVTGWSFGSGTNYDYATIKYNSAGEEQWVARYDGPASNWDDATAIAIDGEGNTYVTGGSGIYPTFDYATVKYSSTGVQQWVARYDGPAGGNDEAFALALDGTGNVYVTGYSDGSGTYEDYATIKYSQDVGIAEKPEPEIADYDLQVSQLNPGSAGVEISYFLPVSTWLSLRIYDAAGREVKTLVSGKTPAGSYSVTWDGYDESGAHLAQGVYFVRLEAGSFNATKKVILHR